MKFNYEYRTSDNVRHTGVIAASNREAAFAALKSQGIRPGCLAEAPGFFNKLFGKGKRWLAIGVLGAALVGSIVYTSIVRPPTSDLQPLAESLDSAVRRQIIGDSAVIEKGIRTGWADVFALEGDRFLASFAIPGVEPALRTTTEEKLREALNGEALSQRFKGEAPPSALEARQVIAIVSGMKREINALLKDGWTLHEVGAALAKRQQTELAYYNRVKTELETMQKSGLAEDELEALWERRNNELRQMGVKLVPMPD